MCLRPSVLRHAQVVSIAETMAELGTHLHEIASSAARITAATPTEEQDGGTAVQQPAPAEFSPGAVQVRLTISDAQLTEALAGLQARLDALESAVATLPGMLSSDTERLGQSVAELRGSMVAERDSLCARLCHVEGAVTQAASLAGEAQRGSREALITAARAMEAAAVASAAAAARQGAMEAAPALLTAGEAPDDQSEEVVAGDCGSQSVAVTAKACDAMASSATELTAMPSPRTCVATAVGLDPSLSFTTGSASGSQARLLHQLLSVVRAQGSRLAAQYDGDDEIGADGGGGSGGGVANGCHKGSNEGDVATVRGQLATVGEPGVRVCMLRYVTLMCVWRSAGEKRG
jgi:hypothetical protein